MLQDRVWSAFCHGRANFEFILVSWFRRCSVSALPKLSTRNKSSPRCSPSASFIRCEISCFRTEFGMHFVTGEQISKFILVPWFQQCSVSAPAKLSTRHKSSPRCSPSDSFIRCEISCFRMEFGMHFVTGEQISNSFWFPGFNSAAFQPPQNCPPDTNPLLAAVPVLVSSGVKFHASGSSSECIL